MAPFDVLNTGLLAGLLVQTGDKNRAERVIATMSGSVTIGMAMYHLVCSQIDAAIDCFQQDIELGHPNTAHMVSAGFLRPVRSSPRWPKLASMMNLPAEKSS